MLQWAPAWNKNMMCLCGLLEAVWYHEHQFKKPKKTQKKPKKKTRIALKV